MQKIFVSVFIVIMLACSSVDKKENLPKNSKEFDNAPQWIISENSGNPKEICGIGAMNREDNMRIAQQMAQVKGREALANKLYPKVYDIIKEFNDAEKIAKQITAITNAQTKELWHSNSGTVYALVCTDAAQFSEPINRTDRIDEDIKKTVLEKIRQIF